MSNSVGLLDGNCTAWMKFNTAIIPYEKGDDSWIGDALRDIELLLEIRITPSDGTLGRGNGPWQNRTHKSNRRKARA